MDINEEFVELLMHLNAEENNMALEFAEKLRVISDEREMYTSQGLIDMANCVNDIS